MKEPRLEPDSPAHGVISYDARIAADTDVSASSYASTVSSAPLESLEVHDQAPQAPVVAPMTDKRFTAPFSRRKAAVVSTIITVLVVLLTGGTLAVLSRETKQPDNSSRLNLGSQDVQLKNQSGATAPAELQGVGNAVLINGDLITRGQLKVTSGAYLTLLRPANLTSNRNLTLPDASGVLCVDSNNCDYATNAQLQQLQSRLGQIVIPAVPDATTVNGLSGAVSVQGASNQISVTTTNGVIALATPQDLAPISSPTFANLLLNGNFSVSGTVTLPLNCSGMLNGGALTTNASGQIICSGDDSTSGGGGGAVTTAGGTAGNLAIFTAADTIADSIITQALGAITIGGNTTVSGTLSANSLTLATALSVANGGTGATTFTTNGVLLGNGTGAVTSTTSPTAGQVLLGNASNVPQFTTVSGDVVITGAGVTTIQADSVALGVDTTGNYVANLGTLTGLTTAGNTGEGSTPSLSVTYGSTVNTSVQGNTSISVSAGTNLTGGGSITLGSGGSVTLNVTNSPTFTGNIIAQGGAVTIGNTSGGIGSVVLHDGNGQIGSLTTTDLTAGRTYTFPDATGTVCLNTGNCVGGTGGAPNAATYLTIGNNATLTNERSITAGTNIGFTDGGANGSFTIDTVNNPNFSTSVTTPLLQSSGALSITPNGALTVGATGQTALLQGSTTTITSNGAGNDIVLTSADAIRLTGFNCTTFANGGALTTDASGNLTCTNDDGGAGGAITGSGTSNRIALFTGSQTMADSWLLQNGSTLELDNTRNLSLLGGTFSVTGTGTFSGLLSANGNLTIESGDTFTMNGDAFTDLTGTGLVISSGSLQTTLGTSVDLTSEITGTLSVTNGGTGVNGSTAANGQLLIGNGTGYTLATLTPGAGISITNAAGSITVASSFGSSIDLGTETTGNYQAATTAGNGISVGGAAGAGWTASVALGDLTANWNQTGAFDIVLNNANSQLKVLESAGGTYFGSIDVGDLTADRTYTFPDASGTICLSTGNCAGAGGGITGSGTTDTIAKFTGAGAVGDSSISDNGSVVTLNGTANLVIQGGTATFGTTTQAGTLTISDGSSNTVSIVASAFAANQTYTLPDVGGAATFCLSTGNCVGGGGGGAPNAAAYLVASLDGTLTSERALAAGSNISLTDGGANGNFTVATVQNPTFTTSVTTPQLQSSGALTLVSASGQVLAVDAGTTIELQDSTNVTGSVDVSVALNVGTADAFQVNSSGAITAATGITSSGTVRFSALNCTTFTNGGALTTDASGNLTCSNDDGGAAGSITGTGTNGTLPMFTASNVIADSIVTQSGTTVNIAGDLTLNTALAVAQGGTGGTSFTANGLLYGNGAGALQVTAAGTSGQVLVASATGVPTFVSFSGDVTVSDTGATSIQPNSVALGTDTTGDYVANLGTLTGLTAGGNSGEGSTPSLSVNYGSSANTAVQGNTTLTCPSGTGNLSGGGDVITLGTGGTCSNLDTIANPTFSTSVTTPLIQSSGALSITSLGALTVGSTAQAFTLQGNASSTITATGGDGFVTTVGFTGVATGAVTYNFDRTATPGTYTICTTVGNCSGTAATLQSAYNASTNPEIVVDSTRGALTVRDNVTPLTGGANLLEVQSNNGSVTYLGVNAAGASITGNLNIAGTGVSSDVALTVRGNGAQGGGDLITDFQSYDGVTTKSILRVTNDAGLFIGNNVGTAARFGISNGTYYGTLQTTNLTQSRTYELPDADGTICTDAGNCGSITGTLQNAYNYSVGGTTPEIKLNNPQTAIDIQDADTTLGSNANFMSFRASNASGLGTLLVGFGIQGNLYMRPSVDRTDLLDINDAANGNILTLDSMNSRLGFGLGSTTAPNLSGNGIEMRGALKLSGTNSSANYDQNCLSPNGSPLPARFCIASDNDSVGFYGSIAQMGLTSGANTQPTASVMTLFDGRTVAHNLTLRVASPDESKAVGFNWNGSNTTANVQTSDQTSGTTSEIVLRSGNVTAGNGSSGVVYVQSGSIAGGTGGTTGDVVLQSGNALGTNVSSGNVLIDSGSRQAGTGTNGYVSIGATNASAVTISRTGVATTVNGSLTVAANQAFTANGTALFQSATNSATAFQIQNANGTQLLNVNTTADSTNLIDGAGVCGATPTCGGFENGTGNWQLVNSSGNAAMTTTTSQYVFGTRSMDATFGSTSDKIKLPIPLSNNSYYTLNFYAKSDLAASGVLSVGYSQDGSTEDVAALSIASQSVSNTGWTHYLVSIATGTVSGSPYVYFKQNSGTLRHIYVDNIKLAQVTFGTQQAVPHYTPGTLALSAPISTPLIVAPADNSTALQVISEDGTSVFSVDTKNRLVGIGTMSPSSKLQVVSGGTSSISGWSVIRGGASVADSTSGGSNNLNLLTLYNSALSANDLFKVSNGGNVTIAPASGSASAFQVQDSSLVNVFSVDTGVHLLRVSGAGTDVGVTSGTGAIQIGADNGANLAFDNNEIMARSNGAAATLFIQQEGGTLNSRANSTIFRNFADSTSALQVQNATGNAILTVDTTNRGVAMNGGATGALTVSSDLSLGARSGSLLSVTQANDATNNSTAPLVSFSSADTASGVAVLDLTQGNGNATALQLNANLNSGSAIHISGTGNNTPGGNVSFASGSSPFTGSYINVNPARHLTSGTGTYTESGSFLSMTRSNFNDTASGTYAITGDLATLSSNCTQNTGTCTDTSSILSLNQQYASASGAVLKVQGAGTGYLVQVTDTTATAADVFTIANEGAAVFMNRTNSATAFRIQDSAAASLFTVDTTARSASGGNLVKIGNSTGTDGALTILQVDSATADPTSNLAALNGGLFYNSTTNKLSIIENGQIKVICNTTDLGCGTGTVTLQSAYNNSTNPEITLGSASTAGLTIRDNATPISGNLLEVRDNGLTTTYLGVTTSAVTLGTNVDLIMQGANAYISNSQGQTQSEAFGQGATVVASQSVAIGYNASAGESGFGSAVAVGYNSNARYASVAVGDGANTTSTQGVAIGQTATANQNAVALGYGSTATSGSIALGAGSSTAGQLDSIAIGRNAAITAWNQMVVGSNSSPINHVVFGSGVTDATPDGFTLQGTSGSGSNVAGASVNIAAGQGTGTGAGGVINLQTSAAGTTGSSLNSLTTVASFGSTAINLNQDTTIASGKRLGVGAATESSAVKLQVWLTTTNDIVALNSGAAGSTASGVWGQNVGFLSQSSEGQIVSAGSVPLVFKINGTRNSMTSGTEQMRIASGAVTVASGVSFTANGTGLFKNSADSTTAFQIQNAATRGILTVDTSGSIVTLGNITSTAGQGVAGSLRFADGTNDNFGLTLNTTTLTANRTISLPNAGGTICTDASSGCIYNTTVQQTANISLISPNTTDPGIKVKQATGTATSGGQALLIQGDTVTGSTNAFEVQTFAGTQVFAVNTDKTRATVGSDAGNNCTGRLCVSQSSSGAINNNGTTTNLYNYQEIGITTTASPSFVGQGIVIKDTSSAQTTNLKPLVIDTTGSTNTSATVNSIQAAIRTSTTPGKFLQFQYGTSMGSLTDVVTIDNTGATMFKTTTNSATGFQVQDSAAASLFTVDTTARSGSGGNLIKVGNSTGTDGALTILQLDSSTANPTSNLSALNGGLYYNSTTNKVQIIENGVVKELCNKVDLSCGAGASTPLQTAYNDDADGGDSIISLTTADDGIIFRNPASSGSDSTYILTVDQLATGAKGGISIQNAGTTSTLSVTSTGNASAGNALLFGQLTNASISGNLLDLKSGASGSETSKFTVSALGATAVQGTVTVTGLAGASGTSGTSAADVMTVNGGSGGTGSTGAGGAGSKISLQTGTGGDGNTVGGAGGAFNVTTGLGGTDTSGAGVGGNGGNMTLTTGDGGSSNGGNGGNGGTITLQAGNGGFSTTADGSGGDIVLKPGNGLTLGANGKVQIGSITADVTQYNLVLDSSTSISDNGTCSASTNAGALYFSNVAGTSSTSGASAIRACVPSTASGGGWQDVVTSDVLGALLFGVVPDSGANKGDVASQSTAGVTGPCKVSAVSATVVRIESCVAYTAGRRVTVNQNTSFSIPVVSGWTRICLTGSGLSVQSSNNPAETSLPSFMTPSLQLCLAHVKTNGTTITQVYDTRTFTTTQKEYYTVATAVSIGQVVTISGSSIAPTSTTPGSGKILGVVVATDGSTSSTTAKALVATSGPAWVKATAGTVGDYVQNDGTAGYANTAAAAPTNPYSVMGIARTGFAGASCTATPNATNCNGSIYLVLNIK